MTDSKKIYLTFGLVLGLILGWTGSSTLKSRQQGNSKDLLADSKPILADQADSPMEETVRNLEIRNLRLAWKVEDLESQLQIYQQTEEEIAKNRNRDKERMVGARLKEYEALFDLTPDQAYLIGEYEWETIQFWKDFHAGIRTVNDPIPYAEDKVREILSPEQLEIYEVHLEEKYKSSAEAVANSQLARYPTTLGLSDRQKDEIFNNLYHIHNRATRGQYQEALSAYRNGQSFDPGGEYLLTAAEGVLSEEQMNILVNALLSSPNP